MDLALRHDFFVELPLIAMPAELINSPRTTFPALIKA